MDRRWFTGTWSYLGACALLPTATEAGEAGEVQQDTRIAPRGRLSGEGAAFPRTNAHRPSPLKTKAAPRAGSPQGRIVTTCCDAPAAPGSFSGFSSMPRLFRRLRLAGFNQPRVVQDGKLRQTQCLKLGHFLGPEGGLELLHQNGRGCVPNRQQDRGHGEKVGVTRNLLRIRPHA